MKLQLKAFPVNTEIIEAWIKNNIETPITGVSGNYFIEIHFLEDPSQEEIDDINAYWDQVTEESDEATEYQSAEEFEANKLAKRASAKAKLEALGLTEEEVEAILG